MRINGFDQIKAFYSLVFNQEHPIKPQHISLYVFLINQNNRNMWAEWFKCPYDLAMAGACISSKKTYYKCLDDLQKWELIQYVKGVNLWKAPLIRLEVLKGNSTVPQSEPLPIQVPKPLHEQVQEQVGEQVPIHNIKLLTSNLKRLTRNIKQVLSFLDSKIQNEEVEDFLGGVFDLPPEESDLWRFYLETTKTEYNFGSYQGLIEAALSRYDSETIRKVIEMKTYQTTLPEKDKNHHSRKWLAPKTIFEPTKLEKYVNEVRDYESGRTKAGTVAQRNAAKLAELEKAGF